MTSDIYELARGPAAETFESYAARARVEYATLVSQEPTEKRIQAFFESNPAFVPGVRSIGAHPSAFPAHLLLISQPRLTGLRERRPDFMWLSVNSEACYPTLIEIERPAKAVFNAKRNPSVATGPDGDRFRRFHRAPTSPGSREEADSAVCG